MLLISVLEQKLSLVDESGRELFTSEISSALNGIGCQKNSGQTPIGFHKVRAKIGERCPENTFFKGRRVAGIFNPETDDLAKDWILTRIVWLSGLEVGKNRLGNVDTMQRYIYIHGTPEAEPMGIAKSHGCIRMHNDSLLSLFALLKIGSTVWIENRSLIEMKAEVKALTL